MWYEGSHYLCAFITRHNDYKKITRELYNFHNERHVIRRNIPGRYCAHNHNNHSNTGAHPRRHHLADEPKGLPNHLRRTLVRQQQHLAAAGPAHSGYKRWSRHCRRQRGQSQCQNASVHSAPQSAVLRNAGLNPKNVQRWRSKFGGDTLTDLQYVNLPRAMHEISQTVCRRACCANNSQIFRSPTFVAGDQRRVEEQWRNWAQKIRKRIANIRIVKAGVELLLSLNVLVEVKSSRDRFKQKLLSTELNLIHQCWKQMNETEWIIINYSCIIRLENHYIEHTLWTFEYQYYTVREGGGYVQNMWIRSIRSIRWLCL